MQRYVWTQLHIPTLYVPGYDKKIPDYFTEGSRLCVSLLGYRLGTFIKFTCLG